MRDAIKDLDCEITELPVPLGDQGWADMVKEVERASNESGMGQPFG